MPESIKHLIRAAYLLLLAAAAASAAPMSQTDFHSRVQALYDFEPHKLNDKEMDAKSADLDQFWTIAKSDPQTVLPLLRRELADVSSSAFFSYDGSKLLMSLSKERDDYLLALRAIPRADLRGIQHGDYLRTVKWFADNGYDAKEAAFKVLRYPGFKAFIPQHALTLGQNYAFIYMLFPMDETLFAADLAAALEANDDPAAVNSVLLALWYTATPAGMGRIKTFANDPSKKPAGRAYAAELLKRKGVASSQTENALRDQRRKIMRRPISDEALTEFDAITLKLLSKI